jgi:hypothetical protein
MQDWSNDSETHEYRQLIDGLMRAACTPANRAKFFHGHMPYTLEGGAIPVDSVFGQDADERVAARKHKILTRLHATFSDPANKAR